MRFKSMVLLAVLFTCLTCTQARSQSNSERDVLRRGYYLVIAAYSNNSEGYASRFQQSVIDKGYPAQYGFASRKNMYFVYLHFSLDFNEALRELYKHRKIEDFDDCWVFVNKDPGDPMEGEKIDLVDGDEDQEDADDVTEDEAADDVAQDEDPIDEQDVVVDEDAEDANKDQDELVDEDATDEEVEEENPKEPEEITAGYKIYFNPYGAQGVKPVEGIVEVVDPVRAKLMRQYDIYESHLIPDPKNGTGDIELICSAFGYKKAQHWLNLHEPMNDSTAEYVTVSGDSIIVDFALTRLRKGDIAIMFNVFFFRDAAIMKPESKYELQALLTMLQENEKMRIKIHGHTNGNYNGKLIKLNKNDVNFFSLGGNHIETVGTSKALSLQRAYTIQHYLMEEGIREDRMEIHGWGGKRHLFDKHSNRARYNVRVEVEVLEDGT